ncbi:hypothetical protein M413DRAFT_189898 [Hebeloma cylindrosporum]|uniref:Uncharacterized protein n=1 Tax=Hebeloma cylindrosporum TaxID=76867 RepID=A0A0C3C717_HEBCY|nr:hypothetical protein M413DRAFT_189898 [Hebeloma cylindrosporum h7]
MKPIGDVEKRWHDLIPQNDKIRKDFDASTSALKSQHQSNNDSTANSIPPVVAPGLCAETHQFVQMSVAAANPPLLPSVTTVSQSLQNSSKHLITLSECWVGLHSICGIVVAGTPQAPEEFGQQWKRCLAPWEANREILLIQSVL